MRHARVIDEPTDAEGQVMKGCIGLRRREPDASVSSGRMRITFLGQAGFFLETKGVSILADPWFNPAYFAAWFPFPANDGIDPRVIGSPTYLYVSHLHHDHFDPRW